MNKIKDMVRSLIPKSDNVSRFAATWIDVQPLIGGGLLVWTYDNDTIQTLIIN